MAQSNKIVVHNIFNYPKSDKVLVDAVFENSTIKLQRVVAHGQASSPGASCPQTDNDFLVLLKGELTLDYETEKENVSLVPGGYLITTPNQNNRVESTSKQEATVWLKASFYGSICKGSFPSPDLKAIKESMRHSVFSNTAMIESLVETKDVRIERVASHGQRSSGGDCEHPTAGEFVILLKGQAVLEVRQEKISMKTGDYIFIPPNTKNRVESTSRDEETVWLAVYYPGESKGEYPFQTGY